MAVNGIEIEVGQTWVTRKGSVVNITKRFCDGFGGDDGFARKKNGLAPSDSAHDLIRPQMGTSGSEYQRNGSQAAAELLRAPGSTWFMPPQADMLARIAAPPRRDTDPKPASGGGKLERKTNYYQVPITRPIDPESTPYLAECADIIEALNMTFNEGEAFKALWRLAAARQGKVKAGGKPVYDADKVAHYGARVAAQTRTSCELEQAK